MRKKLTKEEVKKETERKGIRRRKKTRAAVNLLGNVCKDCGKTYPQVVYDFHHPDPTLKEAEISRLVHKDVKLELILNEAAKCELLCANCHRIRHSI